MVADNGCNIFHSYITKCADGPYGVFAGHDASRALASFSLDKESLKEGYDDLSDLNGEQMESVREWEMQFTGEKCYNTEFTL